MIKFTVIIPMYNSSRYIEKCIKSIINQKYKSLEIILVDDGSTDNTYNIILEYSKRNSNIKTLKTENTGVSSARNIGIEVATGDYITFIDSDDYIDEGLFEFANNKINETNVDILKYNYYYQYKRIKKKHKFDINAEQIIEKDKYANYIWKNIISSCDFSNVWNAFFKKDIAKCLKFDTTIKYSEDRKFMYEALKKSKSVYISDKAYYHYVYNDNSVINCNDINKSLEKLQNVISTNVYLNDNIHEVNIEKSLLNSIDGDIRNYLASNIKFNSFQEYLMIINKIYSDKNTMPITIDILEKYNCKEKYNEIRKLHKTMKIKQLIKKII